MKAVLFWEFSLSHSFFIIKTPTHIKVLSNLVSKSDFRQDFLMAVLEDDKVKNLETLFIEVPDLTDGSMMMKVISRHLEELKQEAKVEFHTPLSSYKIQMLNNFLKIEIRMESWEKELNQYLMDYLENASPTKEFIKKVIRVCRLEDDLEEAKKNREVFSAGEVLREELIKTLNRKDEIIKLLEEKIALLDRKIAILTEKGSS